MTTTININVGPIRRDAYTDSQASELFRVKVNQIRMMKDRGYSTESEDPIMTYRVSDFINVYRSFAEETKISFKESLRRTYMRDNDQTSVLVYYPETPRDAKGVKKLGMDQMKSIIEMMTGSNIIHIILITETQLTPDAAGAFKEMPLYRMEHFLYEEMTYNPTDHFLTPKHKLLSDVEASDYLGRNQIKIANLPSMSVDDRIARYYGALPGEIFEIDRQNLSIDTLVDTYKAYRKVVHDGIVIPKPTAKKE